MYVITGRFKENPDYPSWKITGLDSRPLVYTTYGIAQRECHFFQELNKQHILEYADQEVIYEVREWTGRD